MSGSGSEATQRTIEKINLISDQMQSIGETVVTLSEQSQAIEAIVSSVQDLADQSNLLAVNASIEAARAGDQGKGFAVVSQEIKSLADESKEATDQIRAILEDTKKWVSAVVMATEQGSKAVDSGVEQSALAGESIKSLVDRVASSAQEASVIAASTQEQLIGIEQASSAMVQIEKAMHQNLEGTSQVETAAKKLEDLGRTLEQLVKYYRV
jgi:methyl-accepting chemotaxis protein